MRVNKIESQQISYNGLYNSRVLIDKKERTEDDAILTTYYYEYFPFQDETEAEIEAERKRFKKNDKLYPGECYDHNRAYYYRLDVKESLPVTRKDWEQIEAQDCECPDKELLKVMMGVKDKGTIAQSPFVVR